MKYTQLIVFLFTLGLSACKTQTIAPVDPKGILFMGHIYDGNRANDLVDERIEKLALNRYEQLWLGGDLCGETTEKYATLEYLDGLFDLSSSNTHWALGNHDVRQGNWDWIRSFTNRELHYAHRFKDIMLLINNTNYRNPDHCELVEDQFEMIREVCDTIADASHLVVLSHHITWGRVEDSIKIDEVANANKEYIKYRCDDVSTFHWRIYPMLKEVQARGVQVVVISGDAGKRTKKFEYQTAEGVWFLASGISNSSEQDPEIRKTLPPDYLLYLEYDEQSRKLWWEFQNLDELVKLHR